jgi:hypothetical protein
MLLRLRLWACSCIQEIEDIRVVVQFPKYSLSF